MTLLQIIVLAIVQGLTEFLPISSSGHLVIVPSVFGWTDQGLVFDIAVHFGSLLAVCAYFRTELAGLIRGSVDVVKGRLQTPQATMALSMGIGTIPAAVAGLFLASWISANLRSPAIVAATLAGYGLLLAVADRLGRQERTIAGLRIIDALWIGLAQALALVPGTSRSGVTITAGLALGFRRQDAARISFLLSAPVILLATIYEIATLLAANTAVNWSDLALGALISGLVAYLSIDFFMRFVNAIGLLPFAIYRLFLAVVILYVLV